MTKKYMITADIREQDTKRSNKLIISRLQEYDDTEVEIKRLDVGDFIIWGHYTNLLLERKTTLDFSASIRDKRIWDQLAGLKHAEEEFEFDVGMLIEGNLSDIFKVTEWRPEPIIAILNSIIESWDIRFYLSPARRYTHICLHDLAKRYGLRDDEKRTYPKRASASDRMTVDEKVLYILEGFPKIGATKSRPIMEEFGTFKELINDPDRLSDIHGIGKKTCDYFREIVDYDFRKNCEDKD